MSNTLLSSEQEGRAILAAYKKTVIDGLYNEMLAEIKPKLRAAATNAVAEMSVGIQTYLDRSYMEGTMHVQLSIKGLEGESK